MVEFLEWDSDFLNLKIGKVEIKSIEEFEYTGEYDLIYIFSDTKFKTSKNLALVDEKFEFSKSIVDQTIIDREIVEFNEVDFHLLNGNQKQSFLDLVYLSGHLSRFKIDINLPIGSFEKLYLKWIENSIFSEIHKVFVYKRNEEIIAFITLELPEESIFAKIGLVAVKPEYQGLGLGKKLIKFSEHISYRFGKQIFQVVTQRTNIQAITAYKNYGFLLRNSTNIYHYWNIK